MQEKPFQGSSFGGKGIAQVSGVLDEVTITLYYVLYRLLKICSVMKIMVSGVSVQVPGKTGFRYGSLAIDILTPET